MKRFQFPLDRVLDWRRVQARIEESKLEQLHAEVRGIESRRTQLENQSAESSRDLAARGATSAELAALASFHRYAIAESARLDRARTDCVRRIGERMAAVIERRRDVKLLENVRERKWQAWRLQSAREADREADELAMLKPKSRSADSS